jgi:hypothetical protein
LEIERQQQLAILTADFTNFTLQKVPSHD